jgi:hypothetical protein
MPTLDTTAFKLELRFCPAETIGRLDQNFFWKAHEQVGWCATKLKRVFFQKII